MTGKRKRHSAEFKARVALEALRGELTVSQLAAKHGLHQTLVGDWKRQAVDGLATVFSAQCGALARGKADAKEGRREEDIEKLHAKVGQLVVERDFLAKAIRSMGVARRRQIRAPQPVGGAPMRAGVDQPVVVLLPAHG